MSGNQASKWFLGVGTEQPCHRVGFPSFLSIVNENCTRFSQTHTHTHAHSHTYAYFHCFFCCILLGALATLRR